MAGHRSSGTKTFVAVDPETSKRILGYYTLSPGAIAFARVTHCCHVRCWG
jgi:hypothetical protein